LTMGGGRKCSVPGVPSNYSSQILISHVSSILRTEGNPGFVQSIVGILHQA
ncbi:hypothetical protein JTE90_019784, partial [Oedothorax gibbosus]